MPTADAVPSAQGICQKTTNVPCIWKTITSLRKERPDQLRLRSATEHLHTMRLL